MKYIGNPLGSSTELTTERLEDDGGQRGAVLILMALSLFVVMAMAVFAVDYGWIAYNRLEVRKAAEAAALAGVVHMPLPGAAVLGPGEQAYDTALAIATQAGYPSGGGVTVVPSETASPNQLKVTITDEIDTFFLRIFRPSPITVTGSATAEQLPPLKIGSDESHLGNLGLTGTDKFWVAARGFRDPKSYGDPWSTHCMGSSGCSGTPNPQYRYPGHYYAVEVSPADAGGTLTFGVFDGPNYPRATNKTETGDGNATSNANITFTLYPPDSTPNNWFDNHLNGAAVCSRTFPSTNSAATTGVNSWVDLNCGASISGIYVLRISQDGPNNADNNYALRAKINGADTPAVYGLGSMTLYMNSTSSTPTFKILRLDEIYAGTELVLSLFDAGDVDLLGGTQATVQFTGAFTGIDCDVQLRKDSGNSGSGTNYTSDQNFVGGMGAGTCGLAIKTNSVNYNGDWLDFKFDIPPEYTCSGAGCWGTVSLAFPAGVEPWDTTTWAASINGTPIHLEP